MGNSRVRVAVIAFTTLFVGSGINLSFGLFLAPLAAEFGGGRAAVSLGATANLLVFGLTQPVFGRLVDAWGPRRVIVAGLGIMALGNLAMAWVTSLWQVSLFYGFLGGAGVTAAGILSISVLVLRWFAQRRGTALTVIATGSSLGQAFFYQLTATLIARHGWRPTYALFGVVLVSLVPLWLVLVPDEPEAAAPRAARAGTELRALWPRRTFLLLGSAYLACGFTDFMITTHLAALALDRGLGPRAGATALSVLAAANVIGLLAAGRLADRVGHRRALAAVYALRALALSMLPLVAGATSLYAFAFLFGLTFFTTAPLTSALVNELYGLALTGSVFGLLGAVHHLAGAGGSWLAGAAFDLTGSYLPVFAAGALLVYGASIATWMIRAPARAATFPTMARREESTS